MPISQTGVFEIAFVSLLGAMLPVLLLGSPATVFLRRHCAAPLASDSKTLNRLHSHKSATPTMGGLFVIAGLSLPAGLFAFFDFAYFGPALVLLLGLAAVGMLDDSLKIRRAGDGISAGGKLVGQTAVALLVAILVYRFQSGTGDPPGISLPFSETVIPLGLWFIPWTVLVVVAASNAVNLTDGLDGLASGCLLFAAAAMGALAYVRYGTHQTPDAASAVYLAAALVGASAGFLVFNRHPARVFLGDTGSLPLGGLLGYLAVTIHQEFVLVVVGGVFVVETLSVIIQVVSFRLTRKRVFRCAPVHHHFRFAGWSEEKTVRWFWAAAAVCAVGGVVMGW